MAAEYAETTASLPGAWLPHGALAESEGSEMIERIGLSNFLEGMDIPVDPNMIKEPRSNPYFRSDDWDEQVAKWVEYKQQAA